MSPLGLQYEKRAAWFARAEINRSINMKHLDSTHETISHAIAAYMKEDFQHSIDLFSEVLAAVTDDKLALVSRGSAHLRVNELESARADFDRVIALNPDYARAYHLRGLVKARQGDDPGAIEDFGRALALDANYAAAYASRASIYQNLGQDALAAEDLQAVINLMRVSLETAANEGTIWQTHHMRVEDAMETELNR
jgi:tetratricopeptide (TPR) repeat protein